MVAQNAGTVTGPPPEVLAALWRLCPEVGRDVTEHWHAPLSSYARHLWRPTSVPTSRLGATARSILRETLQDRLAAHMSPESLQTALGEFDRRSVIQTGLHCQLLLDRITFDAFLLSWLGAVENSLSAFFVFTGTTMTMETIGREGPGWLDLGVDKINLFGVGRHKLSRKSVCATGPVSLNKRALEAAGDATDGARWLGVLLERADEVFGNAADGLAALNESLAAEWDHSAATRPIFFDDRLAAAALARHLEDEDSIPSKLLTDPRRRLRLEQALQIASSGPFGSFLPTGTVYFWGVRNERVRKLVVEQERLIEPERPQGLSIPLDRPHLREALLGGTLLPNLFLLFLVLAILPRVRVLGGLRQIGYVPIFQSVVLAALDGSLPEERDLAVDLKSRENAWGMRVIDEPYPVRDQLAALPAGAVLPELHRRYRNRTLCEVTQNLEIVRENARWRKLAQAERQLHGSKMVGNEG